MYLELKTDINYNIIEYYILSYNDLLKKINNYIKISYLSINGIISECDFIYIDTKILLEKSLNKNEFSELKHFFKQLEVISIKEIRLKKIKKLNRYEKK